MSGPGLKVVDGTSLPDEIRGLLKPGEAVTDAGGATHFLPRFFYEIESWDQAKQTQIAPHFALSELMAVDCREAAGLLRKWPHYVPCAVLMLARYLELFREKVQAPVFISANGGYRSPAHGRSKAADPHLWAAAADIYRVGDTRLDKREAIEKFGEIAAGIGPEVYVKPFGSDPGQADDHLHLDIGYVGYVPRQCDEALPQ